VDWLLCELGVIKTHGRSHVSNDNAFSLPTAVWINPPADTNMALAQRSHVKAVSNPLTTTAHMPTRMRMAFVVKYSSDHLCLLNPCSTISLPIKAGSAGTAQSHQPMLAP